MYKSSHGEFKDNGMPLQTTITGQGLLPCGEYKKCEVLSVSMKDDTSTIIIESHRGSHVEDITPPLPKWIEVGSVVNVNIKLGDGVYARRNSKGQLALFDAITQKQVSKWTANIVPFLRNHILAEPSISLIKCGEKIWERSVED